MGETYVKVKVENLGRTGVLELDGVLVDTGSSYPVLPGDRLRAIGVAPERIATFELADGGSIQNEVGTAYVTIEGVASAMPVAFGRPDDPMLLGHVALQVLGFCVDPLKERLVPRRMLR